MNNQVWTPALKAFIQPGERTEAISWSWYHMRRQAAGVFLPSQSFFNVAKGGTDGAVTVTELESNMEKASAITAPKSFLMTAMSVAVYPESTAGGQVDAATSDESANSIEQVVENTVMTFNISDKRYLELPTTFLPAASGLAGFSGTGATVSDFVSNGVPSFANAYNLLLPIPFEIAFAAMLTAPKPFTTTAAVRIMVALHGILKRPLQ
jgi:hypothetical protein